MTVREMATQTDKKVVVVNAQTGHKVGEWEDFPEWQVQKIVKAKKTWFLLV